MLEWTLQAEAHVDHMVLKTWIWGVVNSLLLCWLFV